MSKDDEEIESREEIVESTNAITIADWIMVGATVAMALVAIVAIFQTRIHNFLVRPKLDVQIVFQPPDCQKLKMSFKTELGKNVSDTDVYYLRIRVFNKGNTKAEFVEVFASKLTKEKADGTYRLVHSFTPMNLVWSNFGEVFLPAISPGTYKTCDVFHVIDPKKRDQVPYEDKKWEEIPKEKTILSFDTFKKPLTLGYLAPSGKYQLEIIVAASNAKPVKKIIGINLTGRWYNDESKMLGEGVGIKFIQ